MSPISLAQSVALLVTGGLVSLGTNWLANRRADRQREFDLQRADTLAAQARRDLLADQVREQGRSSALRLLDLLGDSFVSYDEQDFADQQRPLNETTTPYEVDRDLAKAIRVESRLLPNPEVRELVALGANALLFSGITTSGMPVRVRQRGLTTDLMSILAAYLNDQPIPVHEQGRIQRMSGF